MPDPVRGGTVWMPDYDGERTLLIPDFDGEYGYGTLKRMMDGTYIKFQNKGGHNYAEWDSVVITSNFHPREWYPKERSDCWIYDNEQGYPGPLQRRITNIVQFEGIWPVPLFVRHRPPILLRRRPALLLQVTALSQRTTLLPPRTLVPLRVLLRFFPLRKQLLLILGTFSLTSNSSMTPNSTVNRPSRLPT